MKILKQYLIIMGCLFLGELISKAFHISVPGNVIGMIMLLILLLAGIVKLEDVEEAANTLIKNMSLFFVPVGAGIILYFGILAKSGPAIAAATIISTLLTLVITGFVTQALLSIGERSKGKNDGGTV